MMEFTGQIIFLTAFATMLISQIAKMIVISMKRKALTPMSVFEMAGMPSSHTAAATAVTLGVYFAQGFSVLFAVMLMALVYVIAQVFIEYRSIGFHAKIISEVVPFLKNIGHKAKRHNGLFENGMREDWGHTPFEILAGFALGAAVTIIVSLL